MIDILQICHEEGCGRWLVSLRKKRIWTRSNPIKKWRRHLTLGDGVFYMASTSTIDIEPDKNPACTGEVKSCYQRRDIAGDGEIESWLSHIVWLDRRRIAKVFFVGSGEVFWIGKTDFFADRRYGIITCVEKIPCPMHSQGIHVLLGRLCQVLLKDAPQICLADV